MIASIYHQFHNSLLFLIIGFSTSLETDAQDVYLTEMPDQVRVYGMVCDENGIGVPNAEVHLVVSGRSRWEMYRLGNPETRWTRTNATGEFSLALALDDPILRSFSRQYTQFVLVQSVGYTAQIVDVQLSRLMIDLPLKITIRKSVDAVFRVLDSNGEPVRNAKVTPAKISGKQVFLSMPWLSEHRTDAVGMVTVVGQDSERLDSVYVETPTMGNHLVPITAENGALVARLPQTGRVTGRLALTDGADVKKLTGTRLSVLTVSAEFGIPSRFSWSIVQVDETGNFTSDWMGSGVTLVSAEDAPGLGYVVPPQEFPALKVDEFGSLSTNVTVNISPLQSQEIKFVDEDGRPLPGIRVDDAGGFYGLGPQLTADDGIYTLCWPQGQSMSGQLFPLDAFELYQITDAFGVDLERLERNVNQPIEVRMTRSQSLRGIVADATGNRIANAKISYAYASERFRLEEHTFSDQSGQFEIRGLPPTTAVEIRATLNDQATEARQVLSITAGTPAEITLVLVPRVVASPVGRIVDHDGNPVVGVRVILRKGVPTVEEGFNYELLTPMEINGDFPPTLTNNDGRFQFPAIPEFSERMKLTIQKPGFLTHDTPFYDGSARTVQNQQVDLGDIMIVAEPAVITSQVQVLDGANGQPLANAEVVFVGIVSGRALGVTDAAGNLKIDLKNTPQIVGVLSSDHRVHFEFLEQVTQQFTIRLAAKTLNDERRPHPWFQRDSNRYLAASQHLLDQLAVPLPRESTFVRQYAYFQALAGVDYERMRKLFADSPTKYEYQNDFTSYDIKSILKQSPQTAIKWCRQTSTNIEQRIFGLALAATIEANDIIKDELYGEAVVLLNELSGANRLRYSALVSQFLLLEGRIEDAEAILAEAAESSVELKQGSMFGDERQRRIFSRTFLPMYSILNLEESLRLIQLNASPLEKDDLATDALLMHSLASDRPLKQLLKDYNVQFSLNDRSFLMNELGEVPRLAKWVEDNMGAIPTTGSKLQMIFLLARHLPPGEERTKLMREAAHVRAGCSLTNFYDDPAVSALREIVQFQSLLEGELDEFTFACLKHAPDVFHTRTVDTFGTLVKLMSLHNCELARRMLQSAIDAEVWHGGVEHPTRFSNNHLLRSAAWIDPEFACEVAETLGQRRDREGATYKLQLYSDMIQALNDVRLGTD